ncbi:MAG: hypothetical protein LDL41_24655 [Coleofasciculus sp. S288]|nr:hypothetical protein [Coleofasciculus sp. S288]
MNKPKATEGSRVAQEIAAIRAALKKCGYRIQKRSKQAVWKVFTPLSPPRTKASPSTPPLPRGAGGVRRETGEYYLLTYQPAPISAWVLHPQNNDADYQAIATIIQRAIKKQPANILRRAS